MSPNAHQKQSALNPYSKRDPEGVERCEINKAAKKDCDARERDKDQEEVPEDECRRCTFGRIGMQGQCDCSNHAITIDLTADEPPAEEDGSWTIRGHVSYLAKEFNATLELDWIRKQLESEGLKATTQKHRHGEDRVALWVYELRPRPTAWDQ